MFSTAAATASGSRRSTIWWLATFDRRVLEVEDVDLGAELGESLDRGGAHPGTAAPAHDHPLAFVAERQCHHVPPVTSPDAGTYRRATVPQGPTGVKSARLTPMKGTA